MTSRSALSFQADPPSQNVRTIVIGGVDIYGTFQERESRLQGSLSMYTIPT